MDVDQQPEPYEPPKIESRESITGQMIIDTVVSGGLG
jgi:hypothetical protein